MSLGTGIRKEHSVEGKSALLRNPFFNNATPYANPAPKGGGAMRCPRNYLYREQICVQVIQHYRKRGMPQRRGEA